MKTLDRILKLTALASLLIIGSMQMSSAQLMCQALFQYSNNPAGTTAIAFYDSSFSSGSIISWNWDFGDGTTSTLQNPTHSYNATGTFLVCLTITSVNPQCTSVYCDTISVGGTQPNCSALFAWNQNTTAPIINFTNQSVGPYIYWDFGDGTTSTTTNPIHTYANPGTYNVCITVVDSANNCVDTYCQSVTVTGLSSCAATYTYTINTNGVVTFSGSSSGTSSVISWSWDFGDNTFATGQNPTHTYSSSGLYLACLTITTANPQCTATFCDSIFVQGGTGACAANFSYFQNSTSPIINFTNISTGNYSSVTWDFGDGTTGSSANPVHTYANPGTYLVCLTITNFLTTCSSTYCDSVVVSGTGTGACQASFSFTPDSTNTIFQFNNTSTGTNLTYLWNFGDGTTSNLQHPQHTYTNTGIYGVCLTVTGGGCTSTLCDTLYVGSTGSCVAYFTWGATPVFLGINYQNFSAGSQLTYFWDFGDGTTSTQQHPSHTYTNPGAYLTCLTISDLTTGCTDTYCDSVSVGNNPCIPTFTWTPDSLNPGNGVVFFNVISPCGGTVVWNFGDSTVATGNNPTHQYGTPGWFTVCITVIIQNITYTYCDSVYSNRVLSINHIDDAFNSQLYPNPAHDFIDISLNINNTDAIRFEIVDITGRIIQKTESSQLPLGNSETRINLNGLDRGMYFVRISSSENSTTIRFLIQ